MMKNFILYICFIMAGFAANAQTANDVGGAGTSKEEKLKALYVAYISQQLNFTPEEAQKFWPIHAQYEAELQSINKSSLSELDRQQSILNVKKKYQNNFVKVIGNDRSNNFYRQDEGFRKKMMERLQQIRQQRKSNMQQGAGRRRMGQ